MNCPPLLEGGNYAYSKVRMRIFIMTLDKFAWKTMMCGWYQPTSTNAKWKISLVIEKDEKETKKKLFLANNKGLNAIFFSAAEDHFKAIST